MLLQFSIKNFKTFKEEITLSFIASNYDKDTRSEDNVVFDQKFNLKILKSAVIYGANASGKSKLIEAFKFIKDFIVLSSKESRSFDKISIEPFKLNSNTENDPSEFEIILIYQEILYRYGFKTNENEIISEWLYRKAKIKEEELFYRQKQKFEINSKVLPKIKFVTEEDLVRNNSLTLSVGAQFNDEISLLILEWFRNLKVIFGLNEFIFQNNSKKKVKELKDNKTFLELLKVADFGISDIKYMEFKSHLFDEKSQAAIKGLMESSLFDEETLSEIYTFHKKYDENKNYIGDHRFSLNLHESEGTKKYFYFLGPIIDALENGEVIIIDELDSKLHPNLTSKIVSLFNSKRTNPKGAQLIFSTHDTNLLSSKLFRRDQIWFIDKNKYGEARLYSLADFKGIHKKEAFEDNYIKGKYGAVPYLGLFNKYIDEEIGDNNQDS